MKRNCKTMNREPNSLGTLQHKNLHITTNSKYPLHFIKASNKLNEYYSASSQLHQFVKAKLKKIYIIFMHFVAMIS